MKQIERIFCGNPCQIYRISDADGEAVTTCYTVFPGVDLIYNDIHAGECGDFAYDGGREKEVYEIHHCREGRMEWEENEAMYYLSPGDICIRKKRLSDRPTVFPSRHYHGVSLKISTAEAPDSLSSILCGIDVEPRSLMEGLCRDGAVFISRSRPELEHVFSELYRIPDEVKNGYFKIKTLEILLFLSCSRAEPEPPPTGSLLERSLAKQARDYLSAHMDERVTIPALAEKLHVSPTGLKSAFRKVCGVSVYGYVRIQKMQSAAYLLRTTGKTILEIAGICGYSNGSKFSAAFRSVMGCSPNEYRKHARPSEPG